MLRTFALSGIAAVLLTAPALAEAEELYSIERTFSLAGNVLRTEQTFNVATKRDLALLSETNNSFQHLRDCYADYACHGEGGGPEFLKLIKELIGRIQQACARYAPVIQPERGVEGTVRVTTNLSGTFEVSGISETSPFVYTTQVKIVLPLDTLAGVLENVTLRCSGELHSGLPDINSVHNNNDVCHGSAPNGTCWNASTQQFWNQTP
jgi:hypothetical protein